MLGNIKIFFGKIVDVKDTGKLNRCRVSIDALTDEIKPEELPWYFPWYGINYLPVLNDVVGILIFDNNFSTGFYTKKLDLIKSELSDDDYENYLEIFKRSISDKNVQLTYTKSKGIEFINGDGKTIIGLEKLEFFLGENSISMTKDQILIGNKSEQYSLLGDVTVKELHAIIKHQSNTIKEFANILLKISSACTNPFTAPIAAQIGANLPKLQLSLNKENAQIDSEADKLQSKKVKIE